MPTYADLKPIPDPVLSHIVIGYDEPNVVGHKLAPVVPVVERTFKFAQRDRSMRRRPPQTRRADHARANETNFGFRLRTGETEEHALDFPFSEKEKEKYDRLNGPARAAAIFSLERDGVLHTEGQLQMAREERIATILRDNSIPGEVIAAGSKWGDAATDIPTMVRRARASIWNRARKIMNTVLLPWNAHEVAMWSPSMREFLGQNTPQFVSEEMLKRIFQVENVVIGAEYLDVGLNPDPEAAPIFQDVWGNDAIFCHVAPEALRSTRRPDSFAYTFRYALTNNDGVAATLAGVQGSDASMPVTGWYEPGRESHFRRVKYEELTQVINPDLGYVFREVV